MLSLSHRTHPQKPQSFQRILRSRYLQRTQNQTGHQTLQSPDQWKSLQSQDPQRPILTYPQISIDPQIARTPQIPQS